MTIRIALYQPEIPQNTGTILRMAACLSISVDLIEPLGFVFSNLHLKRSLMDYASLVDYKRHLSWEDFIIQSKNRIILCDATGGEPHTAFNFMGGDTIVMGKESSGFPEYVIEDITYKVRIPMAVQARSMNIATATAIIVGEALRQTNHFNRLCL